jgi:hypothetical protein
MNIHVFTSTLALKCSENAYTGWAIRRRKNILEEAQYFKLSFYLAPTPLSTATASMALTQHSLLVFFLSV